MGEFKQRLLGDMVAVEPEVEPQGKIKLPDWQRILRGTVVATGPGAPLYNGKIAPMECKVGDRVIFGAATGMESVYCGKPLRIMRDSDVDAVL
jgi:chaperonin GroES